MDAIKNWWGGGEMAFVRGRIWDRYDDDNLIRVKYEPFYKTNTSVMQGQHLSMIVGNDCLKVERARLTSPGGGGGTQV